MTIMVLYDEFGIEIEGTAEESRQLSEGIEGFTETSRSVLAGFGERGERGLQRSNAVAIRVNAGLVSIARADDEIVISGSKEKLSILAQNIRSLADSERSGSPNRICDHVHLEYYPDHFFLAEGSLPVLVSRNETEADDASD
jgi:hypothetical protein